MIEHKQRNNVVDVIRGCAILLVVLGHTISNNNIVNYENTILFRIIVSLQMPLFMLVSGYVTKYSSPVNNISDVWRYIRKRSFTYLYPWFVWTIIVRGILINGTTIQRVPEIITYYLWNMDSGYWFLGSLWTICICYAFGQLLSKKCGSTTFSTIVCSLCSACIVVIIGIVFGINFFAIKLSLYYLPFFLLGYFYQNVEKMYQKICNKLKNIVVFVSILTYGILLVRFDIVGSDGIIETLIRIAMSVTGCIVFIHGVTVLFSKENKVVHYMEKILTYIGKQTLEIYLVHSLVLNIVKNNVEVDLFSLRGFAVGMTNYLITVVSSMVIVYFLSMNKWSKKYIFGKK